MSLTEKTQFENKTGSFVGAVILDATGKEKGVAVEPHSKIWLSDAEQRLTAQAPRRAEDNPFDERSGHRFGLDGAILQVTSESRPIGSERFVPAEASSAQQTAHAKAAATADEPVAVKPATPVETQARAADWDERAKADPRTTPDDADPLAAGAAITSASTAPGPASASDEAAPPAEEPQPETPAEPTPAEPTPPPSQEVTAVDSTSANARAGLPTAPPPPEVLAGQEQVGTPEAQQSGEELAADAKPSAAFTGIQEDVGTPEAVAQDQSDDEGDGDNLFPGT